MHYSCSRTQTEAFRHDDGQGSAESGNNFTFYICVHGGAPEIVYLISRHDGGCSSLRTVSIVGTTLVEGADGRVHAMSVSCGNDRPQLEEVLA
jgi:hypothetical protein